MLRVSALGPHFGCNNFHRYDRMMPLLIMYHILQSTFHKKIIRDEHA